MSDLPPGWTLEQLQTATIDDIREIPEEELRQIDKSLIPVENVQVRIVIGRAIHNEHQRKLHVERGLPPSRGMPLFEENVDFVVQVVEREGYDDFGYIRFRTDYIDQRRWEQWKKDYERIEDVMTKKIRGWKKVEDKCFMPIYEDEDLQGATHKQIQEAYYGYRETDGVPPGLDTGVCLVVDSAAMDSMATDLPWVYVLDLSFDHGSQVEEGEYPGYFRVALESILLDLYPLLGIMPLNGFWPQKKDKIWVSILDM